MEVVAHSPPSFHEEALEEHLPLEVQEEVPPTPAAKVGDKVPIEGSRPSWLLPRFEIPTEEEALRELGLEISTRTPPLNNIRLTNRYAASFIGGAALNQAADV